MKRSSARRNAPTSVIPVRSGKAEKHRDLMAAELEDVEVDEEDAARKLKDAVSEVLDEYSQERAEAQAVARGNYRSFGRSTGKVKPKSGPTHRRIRVA